MGGPTRGTARLRHLRDRFGREILHEVTSYQVVTRLFLYGALADEQGRGKDIGRFLPHEA